MAISKFLELNNWRVFIFFLFSSILLVSPQFLVKSPGLIDDGTDFLYVKNNGFLKIIGDQLLVDERTRPLRFIYRKILYGIFGLNMVGYYLVGAIILATICFLLYLILKKITLKRTVAFLSTMFFLLSPSVAANFYRLGTDEPMQLLLILFGVYAWLRRKDTLALSLLILSLFVKETSFFFLLLPLGYFLLKRKWKMFLTSLMVFVLFGGLVFYKYLLSSSIYIHRAGFSWELLKVNFYSTQGYFWVELLILLVLVWRNIRFAKCRVEEIMIGSLILASSLPFGFWYMNQSYYLLVLFSLLVVGSGYILSLLTQKTRVVVLVICYLVLLMDLSPNTFTEAEYWHREYIADGALSAYLLNKNLKDTLVYSNVVHAEKNYEIYAYSNEWSTINGGFSPPIQAWVDTFGDKDDARRVELANKSFEDFIASNEEKKILISNRKVVLPGNYFMKPICGYSIFAGNICRYYVYEKSLR